MKCEAAELELSARMDGARDPAVDDALSEHLDGCPRCRGFQAAALDLREHVRLEAAAELPELLPRIMDDVRAEQPARRRPMRGWVQPALAFAASAAAVALVLGGLPGMRTSPPAALATEIPARIAEASAEVSSYEATFEIVERNFHPSVPERRFTAEVGFAAPERFRARIEDRTTYPSEDWPRNDIELAVDHDAWRVSGPATCPREALPACATGDRDVRALRGREPFDGDAPLPTDVILPVRTLAGSDRVEVTGRGTVPDRPTVTVALEHRDAAALFAYLTEAGIWRPFFPLDRVLVSLDAETWFPLAYVVRASSSPERDAWATRSGLDAESAGSVLFEAVTVDFATEWPDDGELKADPSWRDGGFNDVSFDELDALVPADTAELRPHRAGTIDDEVVLAYASGLTWLKVRETRSWTQDAPFGDVGVLAAPVTLPDGDTVLYEPATIDRGRRVSLHTDRWDVYLESNLPPNKLLGVAASLPIRGASIPAEWRTREWPGGIVREQVPLADALEEAPYLLLPTALPDGYERATIHSVRADDGAGVTVYYRRTGAELDGVGIRLHQAPDEVLAPPMDPDVFSVAVRGVQGRYSPTRHRLEWVEAGVYRSILAPGLDLVGLVDLADSLEATR